MKHEDRMTFALPKSLYKFLLFLDAAAIIVSMVAGPTGHTGLSLGASASAIFLSLCLLLYGLFVWKK